MVGSMVVFWAMGQETVGLKAPQMRIQRIDPLLRAGLHHHTPPSCQRTLQQIRQNLLQCAPLKMVEPDLAHS